jgi:hypothetical protein
VSIGVCTAAEGAAPRGRELDGGVNTVKPESYLMEERCWVSLMRPGCLV